MQVTTAKRIDRALKLAARSQTFKAVATRWVAAEARRKAWSAAYTEEVDQSLRNHLSAPDDLPVSSIIAAITSPLLPAVEDARVARLADRADVWRQVCQLPLFRSLAQQADDQVIAAALKVLEQRQRYHSVAMNSPGAVRDYLRLRIGLLEHEVFVVLFLDSQNRLIECDEMFRGTLAQTSVYPREVVKAASKIQRRRDHLCAQSSIRHARAKPRR